MNYFICKDCSAKDEQAHFTIDVYIVCKPCAAIRDEERRQRTQDSWAFDILKEAIIPESVRGLK